MRSLLRGLHRALLQLFGIDPEPVIATLWLGPEEACAAMQSTMRELLPEYRHITVRPASASTARAELFRALRPHRTGMVAALPAGWSAALANAPFRTMAFNDRGEHWFIKWSDPITTVLFLRGVSLDRATLRPWFWPGKRERTMTPESIVVVEGRAASPIRARFAVLTPYMPWPLAHGGAVRIYSLLLEAARDFDVDLFAFTEDAQAPDLGPLQALCHSITYVQKPRYREPRWSTIEPPEVCEYRSPAMARAVEGAKPLQVEYTQLASYGGDILVEHDVTFDLYSQMHAQKRSLSSWWDLYRWQRFEQSAIRRFRPVVMSAKDRELLKAKDATIIGNGVDLDRFQPTPERSGRRLLFVGSFRHFPNVSAFQWFWNEVWPLLNDCELMVVAGPDPLVHWHNYTGEHALPAAPGLDLRGFVADVKPLYDDANIVVVPTLVSAGTNLKVLEAMAMRRVMVSTPSGVGGIGLSPERDVAVAESPADFATAITRLLADDALRGEMAGRARELANARYSWRSLGLLQKALWHEFSPACFSIAEEESPTPDFRGYPAFIARIEGDIVGHLSWRENGPGERELLWLFTEPEHRRHGIGARLLEKALCSSEACWFLEVRASNTAAAALYQKFGFEQVGRRSEYYDNPKEDAIVMRRG